MHLFKSRHTHFNVSDHIAKLFFHVLDVLRALQRCFLKFFLQKHEARTQFGVAESQVLIFHEVNLSSGIERWFKMMLKCVWSIGKANTSI